MEKKLQVFISSTFTDLQDERQAAVKAVLDAGHIPAGMELFKAGNESQLVTIKRWIDDSDTYMLILGGRYGSLEPCSGLSYTQVEYEYAINKGMPVFAVVLSDSYLHYKASKEKVTIFEVDHKDKYEDFKKFVMSKIIRTADDCKDIQLAIHTTLKDFIQKYDFVGWVKYDDRLASIRDDYSRLLKENISLLKENHKLKDTNAKKREYSCGFSYDDIFSSLEKTNITLPAKLFGNQEEKVVTALEFFSTLFRLYNTGITNQKPMSDAEQFLFYKVAHHFFVYGLLEKTKLPNNIQRIQISKDGIKFMAALKLNYLDVNNNASS